MKIEKKIVETNDVGEYVEELDGNKIVVAYSLEPEKYALYYVSDGKIFVKSFKLKTSEDRGWKIVESYIVHDHLVETAPHTTIMLIYLIT
jgi:hypothetical protein